MQHHVEVRCLVSMNRLVENALVHNPYPAKHQQNSTCEQPPTTDHRTHTLVEANGKDDKHQTGDNKVDVQNPATRSNSQVAYHVMNWRVARMQKAGQCEYQYTKYRADYSYKRYESRWDPPFPYPRDCYILFCQPINCS